MITYPPPLAQGRLWSLRFTKKKKLRRQTELFLLNELFLDFAAGETDRAECELERGVGGGIVEGVELHGEGKLGAAD